MIRQQRWLVILLVVGLALVGRWAVADAYDPPAGYYSTATGTGATLKSQLHRLIDSVDDPGIDDIVAVSRSYDQLRTDLQVTDVDPNNSARIMLIYNNRQSRLKPTGGSIPGWDSGVTWNREHSWPQARGVDTEAAPDGSDMHHLFPSDPDENNKRGNLNFGGVFGAQGFGTVSDSGTKYYPGDLDAGLVARAQFYMAVRYDGTESNTQNLELATGNPGSGGSTLGDLNRLVEWHFAAPPDSFERRRNQVIFDSYQHNRNPFIDHPEYVWSIFKGTNNNSTIGIMGQPVVAGATTKNIDLGRVFVGGSVPAAQSVTIVKEGADGTYYEVTTSGAATSTATGRLNAFRTGASGLTRTFNVGLNTTTTTAGLKTGTVTIDNLDITGSAGSGQGAGDGNDTINLSLAVLDHATPSFAGDSTVITLLHDFGSVTQGSTAPEWNFDLFNRETTAGFTAKLDFDSVLATGDTSALATNLAAAAGSLTLDGGMNHQFTAMLNTSIADTFSATYTLMVSDENLPGALNKMLTLTLTGVVTAAGLLGDYNADGVVDALDYIAWRATYGSSVPAHSGADGDGSGVIDDADFDFWMAHFGNTTAPAAGAMTHMAAVPEPGGLMLIAVGGMVCAMRRARRS